MTLNWNSVKKQLRSVIEWESGSDSNVFWQWTVDGDEIKNASKLVLKAGQGCIFTHEGKVQAVWTEPGLYELKTSNIPFWTTITKLMQDFESEHKVGIYFFRTTQLVDQKWGTTKTVKYLDVTYKIPVELKAYGNFSVQITDPKGFFDNYLGTRPQFTFDNMREMFLSRLEQPMKDYFGEAKLSYVDVDGRLDEIAAGIRDRINSELDSFGFKLTDFRVTGTSFDEKTLERISKIADASAEAQALANLGTSYERTQQLEALKMAAKNEGGAAGLGMTLGTGLAAAQAMAPAFAGMAAGMAAQQQAPATSTAAAPAPVPAAPAADDPMERLKKLKAMFDGSLISQEDFESKKKEILAKI